MQGNAENIWFDWRDMKGDIQTIHFQIVATPLLIFHTTGDDKVSVKQADKLVEQLKKYQKDYEYVTFDSHVHGDLRKTDVKKINKWLQ